MISLVKNSDNSPQFPHIFFNDLYIGGIDELAEKLLQEWDDNDNGMSSLQRYEAEVGNFPDSLDPRLKASPLPTMEEITAAPPRDLERDKIRTPGANGIKRLVLQVRRDRFEALPITNLSYHSTV